MSGAARGVGGHRLDDLEVAGQVRAGAVGEIQSTSTSSRRAGRDDAVGHHALLGREEDVVDGATVGAALDDLDGVDVAARRTDRRGQAAQRPGHIRQRDAQQVGHGRDPTAACFAQNSSPAGSRTLWTPDAP